MITRFFVVRSLPRSDAHAPQSEQRIHELRLHEVSAAAAGHDGGRIHQVRRAGRSRESGHSSQKMLRTGQSDVAAFGHEMLLAASRVSCPKRRRKNARQMLVLFSFAI